jgi:hypothetical protein
MNEVLLSKKKYHETVWHIAGRGGRVESLEKWWEWAKELHLKPEEVRNGVFLPRCKFDQTLYHIAARGCLGRILEKLSILPKELQLNL